MGFLLAREEEYTTIRIFIRTLGAAETMQYNATGLRQYWYNTKNKEKRTR